MIQDQGKVAVITGAGSGIGRSVAITLLQEGYIVVLAGRKIEPLEETFKLSSVKDYQCMVVSVDVTDPVQVENLFIRTKKQFGRLDLLFNNAGINISGPLLEDLTYEQWRSILDTNLTGSFLCTQEAFKLMKNQQPMGGRIINNGSISATTPRPNSAPYTASKHAITGLTKATALDGRKYNIACGQIDIGNVYTPLAAKMEVGVPQADGRIAAEPLMELENVSRAVLYMASLPLEANVLSLTVMATKMPFVGRG